MRTPAQPRWQYLYYVLAAFDVLTVLMSLYLSIQLMLIYRRSVAVNQQWAQRLTAYAKLGQFAMAVNAPGNEVFSSHDVELEQGNMLAALRDFTTHLESQQQELRADSTGLHTPIILKRLATVEQAMSEMVDAAEQIFTAFRTQHAEEAGQWMAVMDRKYAAVVTALTRLRNQVGDIQHAYFTEQVATAARLQRYEYLIALCILLMVGGAVVYGRKLAAQMLQEEEVRHRNEEMLQQAHDQLETRVTERTAALVATNTTLEQEINERKRIEGALAHLSRELLAAQENERRHLARELHDELGQTLTALRLSIEMSERPSAASAEAVRESTALVDSVLQKVRALSLNLRPAMLDDLGLAAALDWHVTRQAELTGATIHLDVEPLQPRPDPLIETVCFRVIQEALTNVARHAQAHDVWVTVRKDNDGVAITIRDDGKGFVVSDVQHRSAQDTSFGLLGMQERISLVGGAFTLDSMPGHGTTIHAWVPLQRTNDGQPQRRSA